MEHQDAQPPWLHVLADPARENHPDDAGGRRADSTHDEARMLEDVGVLAEPRPASATDTRQTTAASGLRSSDGSSDGSAGSAATVGGHWTARGGRRPAVVSGGVQADRVRPAPPRPPRLRCPWHADVHVQQGRTYTSPAERGVSPVLLHGRYALNGGPNAETPLWHAHVDARSPAVARHASQPWPGRASGLDRPVADGPDIG